ncbi:RBR-type E3 ubiquitin transferase [Mycena indigotica]|uniref:RBR-type E3 ubiquitin transferase n=1 Tax=Mycena indigotica TaxID=2126181 RepID=A0A8H6WAQ2_9AGAR|nr:RBR-type E3 ubiquitin transferase [Mycena indigotica]KAF7311819.1 RBR-type E3 ubiquitin transferase [Mycena indigotica]
MSSDYEYSDDDVDNVFDDDELMADGDSDGDDGMEMDDFKVVPKATRKAYELEYDSLSQPAVEKLMEKDVEYIRGILGVDDNTASLLLRHMGWNKERLIEKYMDNANKTLVAAGVIRPEPEAVKPSKRPITRRATKQRSPSPPKSSGSFTCSICFDDAPGLTPLSLECGHAACSGCWEAYITSKIRDEAEHVCRCMAEGCGLVAPDSFIRGAIDEDGFIRFQELLVRHFVGCNKNLKFCPYPSCTNTVSCPSGASKSSLTTVVPIVSCGARGLASDGAPLSQSQELVKRATGKEHKFCFGCVIDSDHRPVVCAVATLWLKKCRDDSETANWIKSNTKECPKCVSTIEKNGGCNHMTCKKCKHEFCWVCMGPWSEHGTAWYSCNRYDEEAGVNARDAQSKSRASLERYLHYYNRWANHEQSAKLAQDLFAKTEKKMEEMQITSTLTWIEVQFMKKAAEELDKCRVTLKWTYAMAYYLAKGNQKELFEDNQRDLERAVEDLSELLESPIEPENIPALRQKVTDKTVYVQKRNDIVLEDTAEGFVEGRWAWNVSVDGFEAPAAEPDTAL